MKRLWLICVVLLLLAARASAAGEFRLAYVDLQRALNESEAGKKAKSEIRTQMERAKARLEKQQSDAQSLKDEIEKKGMLMKEDERQSLGDQYTKKMRDLERDYKDTQDELERKDNEATGLIVADLRRIIANLGEKDGYTMVMEKGAILYGASSIDITDEVIRAYNATGAKIGSLGGPAQAASSHASSSAPAADLGSQRSTISK